MNRILSWPHTPIFPGLLESLKCRRLRTRVTPKGTIRFELPAGPVEMKFSRAEQPLPPGTEVYVWWKGGGFVCAPVVEAALEERQSRSMEEQVARARERLQAARQEREVRLSAPMELSGPELDELDYLRGSKLQR